MRCRWVAVFCLILNVREKTLGLINMLGLVGEKGKEDKVVMFLSMVGGALEFIVFTRIVRVVEHCNTGYVLGAVRITDANVHVRIKI
jgi:hypothetical protein